MNGIPLLACSLGNADGFGAAPHQEVTCSVALRQAALAVSAVGCPVELSAQGHTEKEIYTSM
jgi:hypothetical protein